MNKKFNIAIIINPLHIYDTPPLGIAVIVSILRNNGYNATVYDWNIECKYELKQKYPDLWKEDTKWQYDEFDDSLKDIVFPLLDKKIEKLVETKPDVIGFSTLFVNLASIKYELDKLKQSLPETIFVMGGPSTYMKICESMVESDFIDYLVVGDGEESFIALLDAIQMNKSPGWIPGIVFKDCSGKLIHNPPKEISDLNSIQFPDFSDFNFSYYSNSKQLPISFSRGCINRCTFCSEIFIWKKYRFRCADSILHEMENNLKCYNINNFICTDLLINGNIDTLKELSEKILSSDLKCTWGGSARIDKTMTYELLKLMKQAGLSFLIFGLESGSPKILKLMRKNFSIKEAKNILKNCRKSKIPIIINILVGYPGESAFDFILTLFFLITNRFLIWKVNVSTLSIFPGVELYKNPDKYGIILGEVGKTWFTRDGRNNSSIRIMRTKFLILFLRLLLFPRR